MGVLKDFEDGFRSKLAGIRASLDDLESHFEKKPAAEVPASSEKETAQAAEEKPADSDSIFQKLENTVAELIPASGADGGKYGA